jgi:hypothetical protein
MLLHFSVILPDAPSYFKDDDVTDSDDEEQDFRGGNKVIPETHDWLYMRGELFTLK